MARHRKAQDLAVKAKASAEAVIKGRALLGPMRRTKPKEKAQSTRGISQALAKRLMLEIDERIKAGDYSAMLPRHYVALFCWMHEAIYEVDCVEEVRSEWNVASSRCKAMIDEEFGGDETEFLNYMRFTAQDEERAEIWRRSNRKSGRRVRWRDFFMLKTALVNWRLHKARTEGMG